MDGNAQVVVDILIRSSMGNAAASFNDQLARMERQARGFAARLNSLFASIRAPGLGTPGMPGVGGARGSNSDSEMRRAQADIVRMQRAREKMERDYTRHVENQVEKRYRAYQKGVQRQAYDTGKALDDMNRQVATKTQRGGLSSVFWGNLGANIASAFISRVMNIPREISRIMDEAVKIAKDRENALLGLASVARAKGQNEYDAQEQVRQLRLVKAGIVDIASASIGLKNLMAAGFGLPEAIKLLEAFSDTAAFGKQAALDYGQAIRGATEGIKNGNSILVDNVGLTKNLSIILKEAGYAETDLMKVQGDLNVRTALYNGLLKEAAINAGDADKLTRTYTGSVANLDLSYQNLYAAGGKIITQNAQLREANSEVARQLNETTRAIEDQESATYKYVDGAINRWAQLKAAFISGSLSIAAAFATVITALAVGLGGVLTGVAAVIEFFPRTIEWAVSNGISKLARLNNWVNENFGFALGFLGIPTTQLPVPAAPAIGENFSITKELARATASLASATGELYNLSNQFGREAARSEARVRSADPSNWFRSMPDDYATRFDPGNRGGTTPVSAPGTTSDTSPGGRGGRSGGADAFRLSPRAAAIVKAAEQLGVSPLDLATLISYETAGTFSTSITNAQGYKGLIQFSPDLQRTRGWGKQAGFEDQLMNAVVPYLQGVFQQAGRGTEGASLAELYKAVIAGDVNAPLGRRDVNGSIGQHLQKMMRDNRPSALKTLFGGSESNIPGVDMRGISDQLTAAERDAETRRMIEAFRIMGTVPTGSALRSIVALRADEARATGAIQPDEAAVTREFELARLARQTGRVDATPGVLGTQMNQRLNVDEQYVADRREALNISERQMAVLLQERNAMQEAGVELENQRLIRREIASQAEVDYQVALRRNVVAEAETAVVQERAGLLASTRDAEAALLTLRMQNANAADVAQRQYNRLKFEELNYERDIADTRDALANEAQLVPLRIQAELLRDMLSIRQRETDAVIATNRAQLEMAAQTQYSAVQANARVAEFLASQKGVTEAVGDFKIGLIESGYDLIDSALDRLIPKMGMLTNVIKDLLSSFVRLALNQAFRRLFGLEAPGGRSGGGGFLGNLFGGGGLFGGGAGASGASGGLASQGQAMGSGSVGSALRRLLGGGAPGVGGAPGTANPLDGIDIGSGGLNPVTGEYRNPMQGARGGMSAALQNQMMGAILGGSLGAGLGRGSGVGSALGGVGGMIAGTLGMGLITSGSVAGATTGGIFGSTAGVFGLSGAATFGIGFAIAGGLMLASYLFGRSARRKRERREVTSLAGNAVQQVQQLIADVKAFRIDGNTAYQQGTQIRDQFAAETAKLKTSPGKRLARQKLAEINSMLATLKTEGERADRLQSIAQLTDERLMPTFAMGGFASSGGGFTGFSGGSYPALLHGNEVILRGQEVMALGGYKRLQDAGVRGISMTGDDRPRRAFSTSSGKMPDVYVVGVFDESTADEMFDKVSNLGVAKKVRFAAKNNLAGMVDMIENKMAGK